MGNAYFVSFSLRLDSAQTVLLDILSSFFFSDLPFSWRIYVRDRFQFACP